MPDKQPMKVEGRLANEAEVWLIRARNQVFLTQTFLDGFNAWLAEAMRQERLEELRSLIEQRIMPEFVHERIAALEQQKALDKPAGKPL